MLTIFLYIFGALLVVATALPQWNTSRWWVRLCDFPRLQIAVLCGVVLLVAATVHWAPNAAHLAFMLIVALAALWQLSWIWRHFPGAPREVKRSKATASAPNKISLLTSNVLQNSRNVGKLIEIVLATDPDVFFAVEIDEWWRDRLNDALASRYPHRISYPLSNEYGLALFSRFELIDPNVRFTVDEAIPSIRVRVRLRSGAMIDLYGLHPRPPSIFQNSLERDVELIWWGQKSAPLSAHRLFLGISTTLHGHQRHRSSSRSAACLIRGVAVDFSTPIHLIYLDFGTLWTTSFTAPIFRWVKCESSPALAQTTCHSRSRCTWMTPTSWDSWRMPANNKASVIKSASPRDERLEEQLELRGCCDNQARRPPLAMKLSASAVDAASPSPRSASACAMIELTWVAAGLSPAEV